MISEIASNASLPSNHRPSIRVAKAAAILEVNISTIYRLIRTGILEAHRVGTRGVRVFADSLRRYQEEGKISSSQDSKSTFRESKTITSSNPAYRDAVAYLQSIGCLK
ncbi:MAG: helix-turn-helix domain-containing protein [Alphaproteobacteria bacterium]